MTPPRIRTLFPLAILGLISSILVATLCAAFPANGSTRRSAYLRHGPNIIGIGRAAGFGVEDFGWYVDADDQLADYVENGLQNAPASALPYWTSLWEPGTVAAVRAAQSPNAGVWPNQQELGAGWPFIALRALRRAQPMNATPRAVPWTGAIAAGQRSFPTGPRSSWVVDRQLPLIPVWRGLLLDTLFYALLLWLLAQALTRLRASRRARKNLCPTCAYDLRATPQHLPCPECGTPRPNQSRAAQAPAGTGAAS
jgi:hypothetical protein